MKKLFTKLFLLTTLLMVSSELWAEDPLVMCLRTDRQTIPENTTKDLIYNLPGPGTGLNLHLECDGISEYDYSIYGYSELDCGGTKKTIASGSDERLFNGYYSIEGYKSIKLTIKAPKRDVVEMNLDISARYANIPNSHTFDNAGYNSANASSKSFTMDYYGAPPTINYEYVTGTGYSGSEKFPISFAYSNGKITMTIQYRHNEIGTHKAEIKLNYSTTNFFTRFYVSGTTIKGNQTITWNMGNKALNVGDQLTLNATASSGLGVTYTSSNTSVVTVSGNTIKAVGEGSATITASQSGNTNYNAATSKSYTVTVSKKDQTITWTPPTEMTVGSTHTLSATAPGGAVSYAVTGDAVTRSGNTLTAVKEGTVTITASQAGNSNYKAAANVTKTITVNKATPKVTAWPTLNAVTYGTNLGDALQLKGGSASVAGTFAITDAYTAATVPNAGTYTYNLEFRPTETNKYNVVSGGTATLTVNKANQSITWDMGNQSMYVGGQLTLNATASSTLGVTYTSSNTSVVTVSGNTLTAVGEGNATITASQAGNSNYNAAADITYTVSVSKKDQTITWTPPTEMTVGDTHTLSATATSGDAVAFAITEGDAATLAGNTLTAVQAGTVTITASQSGNNYYNAAANVTHTITVNKATPTVTPWPTLDAVTYGATLEQALVLVGGTASVEGTFVITDSYNAADVPNAGTHTYNLEFRPTESNKYNNVSGGTATLTVNKADQTITWDFADCTLLPGQTLALDATSTCGAVSYELTGSAISVSGNTLTAEAAGTATIKAVDAGNSNYNAVESSVYTVTVSESGYTRAVTNGNYGTICLPYGSSSYAGAEFYEIAYAEIKNGDATGLYLDQIEEDAALVAGKPYIFKATADELAVSYEGAMATTPVAGEAGLTGTLVDIAAGGVLVGNYIIAQNMFWDASAENWLNANRAYINKTILLQTEPKNPMQGRRRVKMGETSEDAATGVDNAIVAPNSYKTIENGQLVIVRDGVKYNAQGQKL